MLSKSIDTRKDHVAEMKATIGGAIDLALQNKVPAAQILKILEGYSPHNGTHSRLSMLALAEHDQRNRAPTMLEATPSGFKPVDFAAQAAKAEEERAARELREQQKAYREDVERRAREEDFLR